MSWQLIRLALATQYLTAILLQVGTDVHIGENDAHDAILHLPESFFPSGVPAVDLVNATADYLRSLFELHTPTSLSEFDSVRYLGFSRNLSISPLHLPASELQFLQAPFLDTYVWNLEESKNGISAITLSDFRIPLQPDAVTVLATIKQTTVRIQELVNDSIGNSYKYHFLCDVLVDLENKNVHLYPVHETYNFRRAVSLLNSVTLQIAYPFVTFPGKLYVAALRSVYVAYDAQWQYVTHFIVYLHNSQHALSFSGGESVVVSRVTFAASSPMSNELNACLNDPAGLQILQVLGTSGHPLHLDAFACDILRQGQSPAAAVGGAHLRKNVVLPDVKMRLISAV